MRVVFYGKMDRQGRAGLSRDPDRHRADPIRHQVELMPTVIQYNAAARVPRDCPPPWLPAWHAERAIGPQGAKRYMPDLPLVPSARMRVTRRWRSLAARCLW